MRSRLCPECRGARLKPEALAVSVGERASRNGHPLLRFWTPTNFLKTSPLRKIPIRCAASFKEIRVPLSFLVDVGLDYVTLDRESATLAGGEAQRIHLATQIGSGLVGVLYVLDEPTIGLHPRDNERLLTTLNRLRDLGNTLVIVEHDEETIRAADWVIGPGPGRGGARGRNCRPGTGGRHFKGQRIADRRLLARGAGHSRSPPNASPGERTVARNPGRPNSI
jgi:excinuclease ABC subunit A